MGLLSRYALNDHACLVENHYHPRLNRWTMLVSYWMLRGIKWSSAEALKQSCNGNRWRRICSIKSLLSKLKGKISGDSGTEQWLAVTSIANPMLEDYETFGSLIAQGLTTAIGIPVGKTDLAIVGSIRI